ncbi:MAG: PqqD family protein [Erysipelotrichaceae bacterium]|nr:PqqD family protein [Erysipelotrichaceae bacterium]
MKLRENLSLEKIENEFIILPMRNDSFSYPGFMSIDMFGVFLWKQISYNTPVERIIEKAMFLFDLDERTARRDVLVYIELFKKYHILENV